MIVNDFKIYCLKKNYTKIHNFLFKFQNHIYDLYRRFLINTTTKNICINHIYEISKNVNINYNNIILEYSNLIQDINFENINKYLNKYENKFEIIYSFILKNFINVNIESPISKQIIQPLYNFEYYESINILATNIGYPSLDDFLFFKNIKLNYSDYFNNHFKIIKIFEINNVELSSDDFLTIKDSYGLMNLNFFFRIKKEEKCEIIVPYYELIINTKQKFIIEGIFIDDYLNLTSRIMSQVCLSEITAKKKDIINMLSNKDENNYAFKIKYLKYCDIGELIIFSKKKWIENLNDMYVLYSKLSNKTFSNIMQDFSNKINKPIDIFNIIKILLNGNDEQINIAGMLFLILKDKKINNLYISDIIYYSLNFVSQIKLKRININLKEEMEKLNELTYDNIDLKKQILLSKNMQLNVKTLAIEKINEMKLNNNDYYKQFLYVKTLLNFPWPDKNDNLFKISAADSDKCSMYLKEIEDKLNIKTYGHVKIKEQLILQVAKWISNPKSNGCAISLNGPPGVGKTLLAKSLSEALEIPFVQITLGGQNDGELLHGHGYTYSGAQPGLIIKKIIEAGSTRCILYLDELDKSCAKHGATNEITSILIHLTDPNINASFQDRFFQGIDFPLDRLIIMTSYNDKSKIDPILLDRFIELDVKPYNIKDKINIVKNYIIRELNKDIGLNMELVISDNSIKNIINDFTVEPGVRDIKRKIELIILKLNKLKLTNKLDNYIRDNKIILDEKLIELLIDNNDKIVKQKISNNNIVGLVNGLYATTMGTGGITFIQISKNFSIDNTFTLKCTGSNGSVMKESIQCAFTCAIKYIVTKFPNINIQEHIKDKFANGFHIHTPEGATPKDGPSAGCAFTIAFLSIILDKPFNRHVAMTGEIDINFNVKKIGGLEYKLIGAQQAGITHVLIPKENEIDIVNIKSNFSNLFNKNFKYTFIETIDDVFKISFK